MATTPATSTATHIFTPAHGAACNSQVHPHTPRSRGVGTPGVIWHRKESLSGLALRECQHLAMTGSDTSTFHATPPRTVPHVSTTTSHSGAVFWQNSTHGPDSVRQGARGYEGSSSWVPLRSLVLQCLALLSYRLFLTSSLTHGHDRSGHLTIDDEVDSAPSAIFWTR